MILRSPTTEYELHPAGIFPAVCVDVIDLGMQVSEWMGKERVTQRVRIVFETADSGAGPGQLSRSFTASLHQKSRLAEFLGKWRGRPVIPGDSIDLDHLIGVSCTLVVSHQQRNDGAGLYASIDAISRPTRKMVASGQYDPKAAREQLAEKQVRAAQGPGPAGPGGRPAAPAAVAAPAKAAVEPEVGF